VTAPTVFDKPNGHGILEIVDRAFPALVNLAFVATGEFERGHITSKLKRKGCHDTQKLALSEDADRRGLQLASYGYQWGGQSKLTLGQGVMSLLENPHGMGSRVAPLLSLEAKREAHQVLVSQLPPTFGGWVPSRSAATPEDGHRVRYTAAVIRWFRANTPFVDFADLALSFPTKMERMIPDTFDSTTIDAGCDVLVKSEMGVERVAVVMSLVMATLQHGAHLMFIPMLYDLSDARHDPLGVRVGIRRHEGDDVTAVPVRDITAQVQSVHDCTGTCIHRCALHGEDHADPDWQIDQCGTSFSMIHDDTNRRFLIFDRHAGFLAPRHRIS
jgi:hypothetical protein